MIYFFFSQAGGRHYATLFQGAQYPIGIKENAIIHPS